jgi:hypothetical protein
MEAEEADSTPGSDQDEATEAKQLAEDVSEPASKTDLAEGDNAQGQVRSEQDFGASIVESVPVREELSLEVSESPIPGWYLDPKNQTRLRFWNGSAWTDRLGEYLIPQSQKDNGLIGRQPISEPSEVELKCGFCQYPSTPGSASCRACGKRI